MEPEPWGVVSLDRMFRAVDKVRERLLRATAGLDRAGVPYAVVGGNEVAAWVSTVDEAAVRNTQVVDVLIRREDLPAARQALEAAGFVYCHSAGLARFLDGEGAQARDAVRVLFAGEKVRDEYLLPAPAVTEAEAAPAFRVLNLEALVRMKLTSVRRKDQVHVQDLIGVGLVDASWCDRLPQPWPTASASCSPTPTADRSPGRRVVAGPAPRDRITRPAGARPGHPSPRGSPMQVRRLLIACAASLLLIGPAAAAPVPDEARNASGPTFVLQVRSLDDLLARLKATAKSFLPEEMYRELEQNSLPHLDAKQLPGVDPARASAFYATIDAGVLQGDFSKSQAVFLFPVSAEKEFISLLEKSGVTVTAQKDEGLYAVEMPNLPLNVFLRFSKNYAYVSLGSSGAVEPKALPDPNEVIDRKETALAVFRGRIDRVPQELKDALLGFIGTMAEAFKSMPGPEPVRESMEQYGQLIQRWYKMGLEGGREMTYRLDLDPKSGLVIDTTLTAKPKSKLAASIAAIKPNQNRFASLLGNGSAAHGSLSLPLFIPEFRQIAVRLTEAGAKSAQAEFERGQAPKQAQDVTAEFFNSLIRTFKDGTFDLAAALRGPDKAGHFAAVGAVTLKETADLEKALKEAVKVLPMQAANFIKIDAHKAGDRSVHELAVGEMLPPEAQRIFGKASVYLCFAPDAVCVSFGTDGLALIKEALDAKRGPAPYFSQEVNGKRLADLVRAAAGKENVGPKEEMVLGLLRKHERLILMSMDVQGGEELRVHVDYGVMPFVLLWGGAMRAVSGSPTPAVAAPAPAQLKN